MVARPIIRIWQEVDIKTVEPHLLITGSTTADCGNCKEVGLAIESKNCPKCGSVFKYIGTRLSSSPKDAKRLKVKRPDLTIIDFADLKEAIARDKAQGFLGGD